MCIEKAKTKKLGFLLNCFLKIKHYSDAAVVMIIWYLDLQLPMQSVHITTKVVSLNPAHGEVYSIQHYVIKFISDLRQVCGFSGYSGFLYQ